MNEQPKQAPRLHALDALRAAMMGLGLVLHAGTAYVTERGATRIFLDPGTQHPLFDWLVGYIHAFRMPVFFVMAGFFGALLFQRRGARRMLVNRCLRIGLPLVVFMVLLWPFQLFAWKYAQAAAHGAATPLSAAVEALCSRRLFKPVGTMHLWFLQYLLVYSVAGWGLGLIQQRSPRTAAWRSQAYSQLLRPALIRPLLLALLTGACLWWNGTIWIRKTTEFLPAWRPLLFYFQFYLFGWLLYGARQLLPGFQRFDRLLVAISFAAVAAERCLPGLTDTQLMLIKPIATWCGVFGFTGLFIRFAASHSPTVRELSDSAYWIYLIHLPLTILLQGLLVGVQLPAAVKFSLVLGGVSAVSWTSYCWWVRGSVIDLLLLGRRTARMRSGP
jgi:hypothetical protein